MERRELDVEVESTALGFYDRLELAKAHCALVFEDRGGKLTDGEVVRIARRWTVSDRDHALLDADLLVGHLFAWLG